MIGPSLNKNENMEAPQNRVPLLWPTYIGERRTTFAKVYGIKVRCNGENVWEQFGELDGNIMRTHWELGKSGEKRISPPPPLPPKLKRKKAKALECIFGPSHWLHENSLPKIVHHHFWPWLMHLTKKTSPIGLIGFW